MLSAILLIPIVGALFISIFNPDHWRNAIKKMALFVATLNFILSLLLWSDFDSSSSQYQFVHQFTTLEFCHFNIGVDGISLYFVLLTTFITPICIIANWNHYNLSHNKYFYLSFLIMETLLIAVFVVLDFIMFYIFFEAVLIPMYLVVGIWGSEEKHRARALLFLYTLAGSLFMLLCIMTIYKDFGTTDFQVFMNLPYQNFEHQKYLWLGFFIAFAIKTPLFPLHIWLPRAHSQAPLAGSILLARLFLKLATYGFLRILITMLPAATHFFSPTVQAIAIISLIYSSFATVNQHDMKRLVAYSSIAHMSIVVLGLFSNNIFGIEGALLLSIAHGLVSPAMFIMVGGVIYDRYHVRLIRYFRGLTVYMPLFSVLLFMGSISNMGIPLSLNWTGEFMSLAGLFQKSPIVAILASTSIVLSACYSIYLFNRLRFGPLSKYIKIDVPTDVERKEFFMLSLLLIPTFLLGICPNFILSDVHTSVSELLYIVTQ